eukprot:1973689-Alexandrium_andersonii.AAC.1
MGSSCFCPICLALVVLLASCSEGLELADIVAPVHHRRNQRQQPAGDAVHVHRGHRMDDPRMPAQTKQRRNPDHAVSPVSYTHLTLPTICSV